MGDKEIIVRPGGGGGEGDKPEGAGKKLSAYNPDVMRNAAIQTLMGGPATLCRISKEQIICEAVICGAESLGYKLKSTSAMLEMARVMSPGMDGLGRGEAVKCLVAAGQQSHMFPAAPFDQNEREGAISRFINWIRGNKSNQS